MRTLAEYAGRGGYRSYWAFLRERYEILLRRRAGKPAPWTEDPVLQAWRFCNVRREDDRVTEWFRENIRGPLQDSPEVYFATIAFRWFNTILTGEILLPYLLAGDWSRDEVLADLTAALGNGQQIFTGAFMINSAPGKPKHIDVLDNLDLVQQDIYGDGGFSHNLEFATVDGEHTPWTKREMMRKVLEVPRLGNFAAYQVVVDLTHTYLLRDAEDLNTFTVAGPGCAKGIGYAYRGEPDAYSYGSKADQAAMLEIMRDYREAGMNDPNLWPSDWPRLPLSDIENGFCEYAKWRTGHLGGRLKRRYKQS